MEKEKIIELGKYISDSFLKQKIIPAHFFKKIASIIPGDSNECYKLLVEIWTRMNKSGYLNVNQPILFSRGINLDSQAEEQLAGYLPEEKILINKDIFRSRLENVDLVNLDPAGQKKIIDMLTKESIGLSNNDILLYFNLIKINQLSSGSTSSAPSASNENRDFPTEIYNLAFNAFRLTNSNVRKITGGRVIPEKEIIELLKEGIDSGRINPNVLSICFGYKNKKFIDFFTSFMNFFVKQYGDEVQDVFSYVGLYVLINGAPQNKITPLNLSAHVDAFIKDRIGRVKSHYYVAMLFIHTYNVILAAQVYEISYKYHTSDVTQRLKLEKLYMPDNRRIMLSKNAENIALKKIAGFKSESADVIRVFKRFSNTQKQIITSRDIFEIDWR